MEYRISVCSPSNPELLGKFQFKIAEDVKKGVWKETTIYVDSTYEDENYDTQTVKVPKIQRKRVYETTEEVRYDNTDDEMSQDFIFTSNKTRKRRRFLGSQFRSDAVQLQLVLGPQDPKQPFRLHTTFRRRDAAL